MVACSAVDLSDLHTFSSIWCAWTTGCSCSRLVALFDAVQHLHGRGRPGFVSSCRERLRNDICLLGTQRSSPAVQVQLAH